MDLLFHGFPTDQTLMRLCKERIPVIKRKIVLIFPITYFFIILVYTFFLRKRKKKKWFFLIEMFLMFHGKGRNAWLLSFIKIEICIERNLLMAQTSPRIPVQTLLFFASVGTCTLTHSCPWHFYFIFSRVCLITQFCMKMLLAGHNIHSFEAFLFVVLAHVVFLPF